MASDPTDQRRLGHYLTPKYCLFNLMVYFVLGIFGWGFYVYMFILAPSLWESAPPQAIAFSVIFVILWMLTMVSYLRTVFRDPGSVPSTFSGPTYERKYGSRDPRFCHVCNVTKPDRSHHCSTCGKCVLKMDHHCPWINNCVGWRNYKFFMLFLMYTTILGIWTCVTLIPQFTKWNITKLDSSHLQVLILIFVAGCFALGLLFFSASHISLIFNNQTTIESFEKTQAGGKTVYNIGRQNNWNQVFGSDALLWFIPVANSEGDGLTFYRNDVPTEEDSLFATSVHL